MKNKYILALDQGTTGSRALIFNERGKIVRSAYKEFKQYYPKPGWVEHDAQEIWESICHVIKAALIKGHIDPKQIKAIGITNQRETSVIWERKTSKPVARAIVWQCRRTADICQKLKKYTQTFRHKTGLVVDPYFSGTKIKWYLDNIKGLRDKARKGSLCFGTIDSWLIWKLTAGASHATDMTNASRTLIFNIRTKKWDDQLLKILGIPKQILPKVQNSGSVFGRTVGARHAAPLPSGIPITGVLGDQQAALYGQGCTEPGTVKNTYGTGCFIMLNTGKKFVASKGGLLTTLASDLKGKPVYALEGAIFIAGAVMQWLRDELKFFKTAPESEKIINDVKDTHGVYLVPAFTGLGAPYWDAQARGLISGLTRGANYKHIIRAALEAIAYQTKDVFELMKKETGKPIRELKVDGGACKNNFLMQFQSDLLDCRILRPQIIESTAQGAAFLAAVTAGIYKARDLAQMNRTGRIFKPNMSDAKRKELYAGWLHAVEKSKER